MSIKIPPGAQIVANQTLTVIRAIKDLAADEALDPLIDAAKADLKTKKKFFAESDLVIAELRDSGDRSFVPAAAVLKLVKNGRIKLADALDCLTASKKKLAKILPLNEIEKLSVPAKGFGGSLYTEWKPNIQIDLAILQGSILSGLQIARRAA